jgi:hypothetical protein
MTINVVVLMGHSLTLVRENSVTASVTGGGKEDAVFRRGANRPTPRAEVREVKGRRCGAAVFASQVAREPNTGAPPALPTCVARSSTRDASAERQVVARHQPPRRHRPKK